MEHQDRTDEKIAALASRSHGVVTRRRLLATGISKEETRARLRRGSLIRMYPGVYRVGHAAPSSDADYMAAVLACGKGAELMGDAAAYVYAIVKRRPPRPVVKTRTERRIDGIETHRTRSKDRGTVWRGIPITAVAQTLMDLDLPDKELARACHVAEIKYGVRPDQLRGRARAVMLSHIPVTLSELEDQFLELLRKHELPPPQTNRPTRRRTYVDCRWPARHLTVELDGFRYHRSRHAWENDRRREREAHARGDEHRRYTYGDVFEDAQLMLAELRALLA
jgi:Transcriptional regulator, AbiEi antitoxin